MPYSNLKIGLIILLCAMVTNSYAQINLVTNGKSNYQIVIANNASVTERRAAEVLKTYIFKISGAALPIVDDSQAIRKFEISIGRTNRMEMNEQFANDGFLIKTADKNLFIYGNAQTSTLYGVYHFLEVYLGCKKYTADLEFVPQNPTITLEAINVVQQPQFAFRQVYYPDQYNDGYRNWHKLKLLEDEWGLWGHTFDKLVPPKSYFKNHPEYYALVNGERIATQLCLTNPNVYQIVVQSLNEQISQQPEKEYWSVSQNDGFGYCTCPNCMAVDRKYGGPQGSLINFVNKVAANFPNKTISTLAYLYSKHPTTGIKPAENVSIMLSTIDLDRSKAIETNARANGFRKNLEGWSAISKNVMIWDYVVQFTNYLSPFPNQNSLQQNLRYFAKNKVKGIFIQGTESSAGEFSALKSYLLAKLSWDPNINLIKERKDFMANYYGKASPFIEKYQTEVEKNLTVSNRILDIYGDPTAEWNTWLKPEQIEIYSNLLDQAEAAVGYDSVFSKRVLLERLPLEYAVLQQARFYGLDKHGVFIAKGNGWKVRPGFERKVEKFINEAKSSGVKILNEDGLTIDSYALEWTKILEGGPLIHLATGKRVKALTAFNTDFLGKGTRTLTDGSRGYNNFQYNYLGWLGDDLEVIIDLELPKHLSKVIGGFLQDQRHWIFFPAEISVSTSLDGKAYYPQAEVLLGKPEENYTKKTSRISLAFKKPTTARYIKVTAKNLKNLPEWRNLANKKPWIFVDEFEVY